MSSTSKGTVLVVGSNATTLQLRQGQFAPIGNYLNEMVVPMQILRAAGWQLLVATPQGTKPPLDPRSVSASHFNGDAAAFAQAKAFYEEDPAFQNVVTLRSVLADGLEDIDAVFVPGGHAPITDLASNAELGAILRHMHQRRKPTALLCHGPVGVLSALPDAPAFIHAMVGGDRDTASRLAEGWPYAGYAMTTFSNSEEVPVEANVLGARLPYAVADALAAAGGIVSQGQVDYQSHVVVDRELITGQNPRSDHELAQRLVEALHTHAAHP
jgi:putative intracellular protease/amidase